MQREVFDREMAAAIRYAQMALDPTIGLKEVESLLRLARARLNGCQSEIRDTGLEPAEAE